MPRCCVTINDPANPTNVLILVEVNSGNSQVEIDAGFEAAEQAAQQVFTMATGAETGSQVPQMNRFTLPGKLTHTIVELGSV